MTFQKVNIGHGVGLPITDRLKLIYTAIVDAHVVGLVYRQIEYDEIKDRMP